MPDSLDSIKLHIAEGELAEALEKLSPLTKGTKYENTIILQTSRLNRTQNDLNNALINAADAQVEFMRISHALLNLMPKLEKELDIPAENSSAPQQDTAFPKDTDSYIIKNIFNLLSASFNNEGLNTFCFKHFEEVYNNFSGGQSRDAKILALIDHAKRQLQLQKLLELMQAENTAQYEKHKPYF